MLTGSLAPTSTQEDCKIVVAAEDVTTGAAYDISAAAIVCEVRDQQTRAIVLSATTTNGGVTLPDHFTFQVWFTRAQMQGLNVGQYDIGAAVTLNGETRQVILGTLPVLDGVVTQ
jgi:hypothetical protein